MAALHWWERLGLLARADAHGVLDRLEERSLLARQLLREAEQALDRDRARRDALAEEVERLAEAARREESRCAELDADAELALRRGEEGLARHALRRWLPRRRVLAALRERRDAAAREAERATAAVAAREERLEGLRARASERLAQCPEPAGAGEDGPVPEAEVELELLRRRSEGARSERGEEA